MILGLFIFLAGAVAGSLFDTVFFKGAAWDHTLIGMLDSDQATRTKVPENGIATPTEISSELAGQLQAVATSAQESVGVSTPEPIAGAPQQQPETTVVTESALVIATEPLPVASEVSDATTTAEIADSTLLTYDRIEALVKAPYSSYHGFVGFDRNELVFSADKFKVGGKNLYQCFVKKMAEAQEPERIFEWPGNVWTPELTPDTRKIVFSSDSRSPEHVFVYDRDSRESKALTMGSSKNMMPSVSPDGTLVAYVSNEKGNNDIWLVGIDGANKIQITQSPEDDREPRWAPDGRAIVFTRIYDRLKNSQIMKVVLDPMGEPAPLVADGGRNWLPDMSPDSRSVAFVRSLADDGSKNTLMIKNLESGKEQAIKPLGNADCFRPIWLSDGYSLVFHANIEKTKNIYQAFFRREN